MSITIDLRNCRIEITPVMETMEGYIKYNLDELDQAVRMVKAAVEGGQQQ